MIVVDSSCLLAILLDEPERESFEAVITGDEPCVISAFNAHEAACVIRGRHGPAGVARLWELLSAAEIEIAPFDDTQVFAAADAFDRYGKGVNPKARLNMADCAAYALAKTMNAPLLFKGADFPQTDVKSFL
jgi:ribonuclease VapC